MGRDTSVCPVTTTPFHQNRLGSSSAKFTKGPLHNSTAGWPSVVTGDCLLFDAPVTAEGVRDACEVRYEGDLRGCRTRRHDTSATPFMPLCSSVEKQFQIHLQHQKSQPVKVFSPQKKILFS